MRTNILVLASLALAVLLLTALLGSGPTTDGSEPPTAAQPTPARPNFVFILADDMRRADMRYMPKTNAKLGHAGMRFTNAYVSLAACCPSRATILRGQYAHNTGVWTNHDGADGGWQGYKRNGLERDNLATRLDAAGYRTGLFGKYLNHYEGTAVPAGWDDWFGKFNSRFYRYDVNDNGAIKHFGRDKKDYSTDVISREARRFIGRSVEARKPFFAYVAPTPPHGPALPAARDRRAFDGERAPRPPSFNEQDVSDKPPWIQSTGRLNSDHIAEIDAWHEKRTESLQALDDLVAAMVNELRAAGELDNTYVVFTSDNGWHQGEHRLSKGKTRPYEESVHMPLLVRGPGVQAGSSTNKLTLNTDFFSTLTDLAGVTTPEYVDGRSLRPLLDGSATTWRTAILLERTHPTNPDASFYGVRTSDGRKYIEYGGGFRELYDLNTDPYELANTYDATAPPNNLAARLKVLKGCAGAGCREAEDGP